MKATDADFFKVSIIKHFHANKKDFRPRKHMSKDLSFGTKNPSFFLITEPMNIEQSYILIFRCNRSHTSNSLLGRTAWCRKD